MSLKRIQEADLENKKILLRVDFNVELENEDVREKFKLEACRETVEYILGKSGTKLALISHLGRPEGKADSKYSLRQIVDDVENILGRRIKFAENCVGEEVKKSIEETQGNEVLLLENVRFYPGEEENSPDFAKQLADNFDLYANDAFSVCHRDQASVTGIARFLPSCAGFRLQKEIEVLSKIRDNPDHPAVAIIGGAKIETKLPLIKFFESQYDKVLVGGKIAIEAAERKINFSDKVILPVDYARDKLDIGPETVKKFTEIVASAKTIVWNGPLGKFEEPPYDKGTGDILKAVIAGGAFTVAGGGESVQVLEERNLIGKISFVSTGGGAMLEYLSGKSLPGIEILMN